MEYADVVWDNTTLFLTNKLENVQIEAARIVTGGTRLVSINSLYKETGWGTLQARRENHKKIYFYKMVNGLVPPYLNAIVPCTFENIHDYNTRQTVSIPPVRTRTTLYNNYVLPSTFNDSRNRYTESIDIPMTVDRLFFGSPYLTDDQNNSLFLNVQKFIINSKRFI